MSVSKISNRYAKSLIDLCVQRNTLDEVINDAKSFIDVTENREFEMFLRSPIVQSDKKIAVFNDLFDGKVHEELMSFFKMVIRKGRELILPEIMKVVLVKYNEMKGVTRVYITSAVELNDAEFDRISEKLSKSSIATENVEFIKEVDPALVGVFIIEIDDKRYDTSIAGKMKKLKNQLIAK